jgi:hypothetical protein
MQGLEHTIKVGDLDLFEFQGVWVESSRYRPLGLAGIVVADPDRAITKEVQEGDVVAIEFGHRDSEPVSFKGEVTRVKPSNKIDQIEICASSGLELTRTIINESYENETPSAIIKYALNKSGLVPGTIEDPGVIFQNFTADSIPVWQVAQQSINTCRTSFNMDLENWALWAGIDGKINFSGEFEKPGIEISFEDNLIRHSLNCGYGRHRVEALLMPDMNSSMEFSLNDSFREIERVCNGIDVRHELIGPRARTYIDYKVV